MQFICPHCGILNPNEVKILCPICGQETMTFQEKNGEIIWTCAIDGALEEIKGVDFDEPRIICQKCGRDEVFIELSDD